MGSGNAGVGIRHAQILTGRYRVRVGKSTEFLVNPSALPGEQPSFGRPRMANSLRNSPEVNEV